MLNPLKKGTNSRVEIIYIYLDQELLYNKHLHVDGSRIEGTGFAYEVPQVTRELLSKVSNKNEWRGGAKR